MENTSKVSAMFNLKSKTSGMVNTRREIQRTTGTRQKKNLVKSWEGFFSRPAGGRQ